MWGFLFWSKRGKEMTTWLLWYGVIWWKALQVLHRSVLVQKLKHKRGLKDDLPSCRPWLIISKSISKCMWIPDFCPVTFVSAKLKLWLLTWWWTLDNTGCPYGHQMWVGFSLVGVPPPTPASPLIETHCSPSPWRLWDLSTMQKRDLFDVMETADITRRVGVVVGKAVPYYSSSRNAKMHLRPLLLWRLNCFHYFCSCHFWSQ